MLGTSHACSLKQSIATSLFDNNLVDKNTFANIQCATECCPCEDCCSCPCSSEETASAKAAGVADKAVKKVKEVADKIEKK